MRIIDYIKLAAACIIFLPVFILAWLTGFGED